MKKLVLSTLSAIALLQSPVQASNTDPIFYADQGKVVIPTLKMGSQVYYVMLNRQGNTFTFNLDGPSTTLLSGNLNYTPASATDIIGTFSPADDPNIVLTFNANGTYSLSLPADPTNTDCPKGGSESGTYQYEATYGVMTHVATVDNNGECGFSHPSQGPGRIKKVGSDLYIFFKDNGQMVEMKMNRKP